MFHPSSRLNPSCAGISYFRRICLTFKPSISFHSYSTSNFANNTNLSLNFNRFPSLSTHQLPPLPRWLQATIRDSHLSDVELHEYTSVSLTNMKRTCRLQRPLHSCNFALLCIVVQSQEPTTAKEALVLPKWKATVEVELNSIEQNHIHGS